MRSAPVLLRLKYSAPCDRCGGTIHEGERAIVILDEEAGTATFTHEKCPTAGACVTNARPKKPGLLSRALRLRGRPSLTLASCLA